MRACQKEMRLEFWMPASNFVSTCVSVMVARVPALPCGGRNVKAGTAPRHAVRSGPQLLHRRRTTHLLPNNFAFCAWYSSGVIAPDSLAFCKSTSSWPNEVPLARCASRLPMAAMQPLRSSMAAIAHDMQRTAGLFFMLFLCGVIVLTIQCGGQTLGISCDSIPGARIHPSTTAPTPLKCRALERK